MNPSSLISALLREVWTKNPEEFKIGCLNCIKSLFPEDYQTPFYAGFGNKSNDETAYTKVKIPHKRYFLFFDRFWTFLKDFYNWQNGKSEDVGSKVVNVLDFVFKSGASGRLLLSKYDQVDTVPQES